MTGSAKVAIWIGCIALILLIVFSLLYILWKRGHVERVQKRIQERRQGQASDSSVNENNSNKRSKVGRLFSANLTEQSDKRQGTSYDNMNEETKQYSFNEHLDGARVSHRRNHPDRLAEETMWKEQKEKESTEIKKKLELDKKRTLFMIYSPVNGDVISIYETREDAKEAGFDYPGILLLPNDDKLYAPINGTVTYKEEAKNSMRVVSETGIEIVLTTFKDSMTDEEKMTVYETQAASGSVIAEGENLSKCTQGLIRKNNKSVKVYMGIDYYENQMLLIKRSNYYSHGDKVFTMRINL